MLDIDGVIVSSEILIRKFMCNIPICKGACCYEGDAGAPIEESEMRELDDAYETIKKYLSQESIGVLDKERYVINKGEVETPLISNGACAYAIIEEGMYQCAFQKAYNHQEITFEKPISCHLYPIRISKIGEHEVLNYNDWSICSSGCDLGNEKRFSVVDFLSVPLKKKFGDTWYELLLEVKKEYEHQINR